MHLESHEVFRAVVECGSVTKASQALHMTQSTASRHLQALEDEYGGLLFERNTSGLTLTALGRAIYPYSCDLLHCHTRAKEEVLRLRSEGGGIVVGATQSIGEFMLPRLLGTLRTQHPNAEIRMRVFNTAQILDDLLHHRIDIALVEGKVETTSDARVSTFAKDELALICGPNHPFANKSSITAQQLIGEPLLIREEGSGTRQITENALETAGLLPSMPVTMELGSNQSIKSAVEAGLGIAFLSKLVVSEECETGRLIAVKVHDLSITRHLYIVERQERYAKYLVKSFLRILREISV